MGKGLSNDTLVITNNLNCVLVLKEEQNIPNECIRCGKCISFCPAKLSPVLIKDSINNIENLKELQANKCIECGLCSYICPSKINVREYVIKAKQLLKEGK